MSFLLPALRGAASTSAVSVVAPRAFSTSAALLAGGGGKGKAAKKGAAPAKKKKAANFSKGKKGGPQASSSGRIQAGGLQLRTQLGKDEASLTDLVQLYPESIVPLNVGKASVFPRNTYDQLKTFGLPRKLDTELGWGTPASVIRQVTIELVKTLAAAKGQSSKDSRFIIHGDRGSGKSMLLIQAVSQAIESGWIVLYAPEARKWVDSSSQFAYDAATQSFAQPELAASLLAKLHAVNRDRLKSVKLPSAVEFNAANTFAAGSELDAVVALGAKDDRFSVKALEVALDALAQQTDFPVLLAIDDAQTLFQRAKYRQPDYSTLESYHLSTPRLALEYFTGAKSFARGAVLGALSNSATEFMPTNELFAGLGLQPRSPITPYTKLDPVHVKHASSGIKTIAMPTGMTGDEAASLFQLFTRKGWASNASDDVFLGAWQGSGGNPKELARAWTFSHQAYII